MRSSRPMPRATSTTSAPVSSQTLAISLMNEILVARKAFDASLTISALATSVRTSGASQRRVEIDDGIARPAAVVADDDPVGVQEVLDGRALLEELGAGHVAEARLALLGEDRCSEAPVPHGTVDFMTSACRSEAGIASTTAWTAERSASPE